MIKREIEKDIRHYLFNQKAIIIYGARQVEEITLVQSLVKEYKQSTLFLNGDDADIRALFSNPTASKLKLIIGNYKIVVIDEAQRIPETGLVLKIIHDNFKEIQLIAAGSSALELANKIKDHLTGCKFEFPFTPFFFQQNYLSSCSSYRKTIA